MKTVHVNKNINSNLHSYYDFLNEAKNQERVGNFKEALMLYRTCMGLSNLNNMAGIKKAKKNNQQKKQFLKKKQQRIENEILLPVNRK